MDYHYKKSITCIATLNLLNESTNDLWSVSWLMGAKQ